MADSDDYDKQYIWSLTLKCADCGLIFRKKHEYVCPACFGRKVVRPTAEEFDQFYTESE
jgi:DNA-directed RNA polymerase subunit RPC12/RpoP